MPIHPDIDSLARYREGQLPPSPRKAIKRHLGECPECRLEYQRLADAWSSGARRTAAAGALDDPRGLATLLAGIQSWQTVAANTNRTGDGIQRRIAREMEKYFGTPATSRILLSVSDDGGNLLSTVEPALALFLGRRAASCLVSCVVDAAIVQI